jgi:hypothetical protein
MIRTPLQMDIYGTAMVQKAVQRHGGLIVRTTMSPRSSVPGRAVHIYGATT